MLVFEMVLRADEETDDSCNLFKHADTSGLLCTPFVMHARSRAGIQGRTGLFHICRREAASEALPSLIIAPFSKGSSKYIFSCSIDAQHAQSLRSASTTCPGRPALRASDHGSVLAVIRVCWPTRRARAWETKKRAWTWPTRSTWVAR